MSKDAKIIWIIGGLSLALAMLLASNTPANGAYEVNIYQAYPPLFWGLLILVMFSGVVCTIRELYLAQRPYGWVYGLLLILAVNTLVFCIPVLRDYAHLSQRDSVRHFSKVANILEIGSADFKNFYPVSHSLAAVFYRISGMQLESVMLLFPVLFYLIYVANNAYLGLVINVSKPILAVVVLLSSPMIFTSFGSQFRPTQFAVWMLPLFVAVVLSAQAKNARWQDSGLLILALVFATFLHPLAFLITAIIIVVLGGWSFWQTRSSNQKPRLLLRPLLILSVLWSAWFMTFITFVRLLVMFAGLIPGKNAGTTSLERYAQAAQKADLTIMDILLLGVNKYGLTLLFLGAAGLLFLWFIIKRRREVQAHQIVLFSIVLFFAGAAGLSLFVNLITADPARYANFAIAVVPVLVAGILYQRAIKQQKRKIFPGWFYSGVVATLIAAVAVVGIFSLYESPLNGRPNHQYSFAQKAGIAFLLNHAVDDGANVYSVFPTDAIYSAVLNQRDLNRWLALYPNWQPSLVPPHFGYVQNGKNPVTYENPGYLWVTAYDLAYYTQVWPQGGRLTPADYQKLDQDPAWNRVYTSGDITIWRWRSK